MIRYQRSNQKLQIEEGQYNGQKKKDKQYNGQKKKDKQYNGQKKDKQYNGQKKDKQYNAERKRAKRKTIMINREYQSVISRGLPTIQNGQQLCIQNLLLECILHYATL